MWDIEVSRKAAQIDLASIMEKEVWKIVKHLLEILLCCATLCLSTALSQDSAASRSTTCGWVGLSLGPTAGSNFDGFSGGITLNFLKDTRILSARLLYAEKFATATVDGEFNTASAKVFSVSDAGLLYGLAEKTKFFLLAVSGGVGYVWGRTDDGYPRPYFGSLALPLELQIGFTPMKAFGICAYVFANLNFHSSFFGTMVSIQIGKVQ